MKNRIVFTSFMVTLLLGFSFFGAISLLDSKAISPNSQNAISKDTKDYSSSAQATKTTPNTSKPIEQDKNISEIRKERIGKEVEIDLGYKAKIKKYSLAAAPNDPNSAQWWESTLNASNTIWNMPAPQKQTVIAVIDTGFALDHQEFSGRFFANSGEQGVATNENPSDPNCTDQAIPLDMACNNVDDDVDGTVDNESGTTTYENPSVYNCTDQSLALDKSCNMIDDDGNGYIDDVSGWDFVNSDASPQAGELREADNVNTYHGTMVAGIAMANANNSVGIAGVDWNAKLLPLQALDDDGYGDSLTVGNAIKYAADMNVDVINLSLGTESPDIIILQAIEYAYYKGVLVVASAGNDGCDCMVWPAKYDITLSVGSINSSLVRSSFSSYGNTLDIVAPGSSITSSFYSSSNRSTSYSTGSGTSFAAPIVSGLVSSIKAQLPTASPLQLTALVTEQTTKTINSGQHKTNQHGYGLISFSNSSTRAITPSSFEQIYKYGQITNGGVFYGNKTEPSLYTCPANTLGTTPIYKSAKSKFFYSINQTDLRYATNNGYNNSVQFSSCVLMPHDIVNSARSINLASETANTSIKSLIGF